ncbi:hypothetical protein P4U13_22450 [Bacillus paranthracis]|nr:hypothetical protein [Bacillus paranthracis]MED1249342.1 hypothetical protein [Bacillus paranthracis]MED1292144.1 hypothetical protein [Bacillus paranthracis]MED1309958.1 hypothetical protein [Bacillus paranthracis]MED1347362.1 hypothetical protein [Bacillus paranthracis]
MKIKLFSASIAAKQLHQMYTFIARQIEFETKHVRCSISMELS